MVPGMVSDLTADIYHPLYFALPVLNILSEHKECRMCIILFQAVQKLVCILSRAIIKGKCNSGLVLTWIISSIIIEIVIVKSNAHPSGLCITIVSKIICRTIYFLQAACIICTIRVLIPFAILILMPASSQLRSLCQITRTLQRFTDCCICVFFYLCLSS